MMTYYGSYRTRTFADIFPTPEDFTNALNATPFASIASDFTGKTSLEIVFALLYSRYGNSHIAFSDENQFAYNVFSTLYSYGPTWAKKAKVQEELRGLTADQIRETSFAIYNTAMNPNTQPTTSTTQELDYINSQNTTRRKKGAAEGYAMLLSLLEDDITKDFTDKFRKFFIQVIAPDTPLLYATNPSDFEITE
jgi:hypothetical protein